MQTVAIRSFETQIAAHTVTVYELRCASGFSVQLMNWGASVLDIRMPDKTGQIESIVLGFADHQDYAHNPSYLGATIGRTAGRIARGRYPLNGVVQQLPLTQGAHVLHGGSNAMSHQLWQHRAQQLSDGRAQVVFSLLSSAGENGYAGNLAIELTYTLDQAQHLTLHYRATTDAPTLCNLTHHSYFNLSGNLRDMNMDTVHAHQLHIHADAVCAMSDELLVNGDEWAVVGSDFDYRQPRAVADILNSADPRITQARGVDHYFIFDRMEAGRAQVMLCEPNSGRRLRVYTDQPCAVLYAHNYAAGERLRGGAVGQPYDALCIETQLCPHRAKSNGDHPARLLPDEEYRHECVYAFDVMNSNGELK